MAQPPEIRITKGSPTPEEADAVREAIVALWRRDQAEAARTAPVNPWVLAGRAQTNRAGTGPLRAQNRPQAWRLSGRVGGAAESHITIGRGDAK